jgi:hypothetical protein
MSDVKSDLSDIAAALLQLLISSDLESGSGGDGHPWYRSDQAGSLQILDRDEDLLKNLDWPAVTAELTTWFMEPPYEDWRGLGSPSSASQLSSSWSWIF